MAEILHAQVKDPWLIICIKSFPLWPTRLPQYIRYRQTMEDDSCQ